MFLFLFFLQGLINLDHLRNKCDWLNLIAPKIVQRYVNDWLKKDVLLDILAEARLIRKRDQWRTGALRFGLFSVLIEKNEIRRKGWG